MFHAWETRVYNAIVKRKAWQNTPPFSLDGAAKLWSKDDTRADHYIRLATCGAFPDSAVRKHFQNADSLVCPFCKTADDTHTIASSNVQTLEKGPTLCCYVNRPRMKVLSLRNSLWLPFVTLDINLMCFMPAFRIRVRLGPTIFKADRCQTTHARVAAWAIVTDCLTTDLVRSALMEHTWSNHRQLPNTFQVVQVGFVPGTQTNNRGELYPICRLFEAGARGTIWTDSQHVANLVEAVQATPTLLAWSAAG